MRALSTCFLRWMAWQCQCSRWREMQQYATRRVQWIQQTQVLTAWQRWADQCHRPSNPKTPFRFRAARSVLASTERPQVDPGSLSIDVALKST